MRFRQILLVACSLANGIDAHAQQLEIVREIGSVDGDSDYTFFRIGSVQVDSRGNIFVLDRGNMVLRVFDPAGQFHVRMGREGSGPGEFLLPTQLRLASEEIHIVDGRQLRLSRFDYTGRHIETAPLSIPAGINASSLYQLRDGSTLLQTIYRAAIGSPDHDPFVHVVHLREGGTHRDTLATYEPAVVLWFVPGQKAPWGGVPSGHGDTGTLAVSGDSLIALVDGVSGKAALRPVTRAGLGAPTTVDLGVRGREFPERLLAAIQDSIRRARENTAIAVAGPANRSALTGQAFLSADEDLWIEIATDDSSSREWIRVHPTDGAMRWLRVPRSFSVRTARDNLIYGVWRDELDVETVRIYRVVESEMNREPKHALNGR